MADKTIIPEVLPTPSGSTQGQSVRDRVLRHARKLLAAGAAIAASGAGDPQRAKPPSPVPKEPLQAGYMVVDMMPAPVRLEPAPPPVHHREGFDPALVSVLALPPEKEGAVRMQVYTGVPDIQLTIPERVNGAQSFVAVPGKDWLALDIVPISGARTVTFTTTPISSANLPGTHRAYRLTIRLPIKGDLLPASLPVTVTGVARSK